MNKLNNVLELINEGGCDELKNPENWEFFWPEIQKELQPRHTSPTSLFQPVPTENKPELIGVNLLTDWTIETSKDWESQITEIDAIYPSGICEITLRKEEPNSPTQPA
jgi:hypothetical protein